MRGLIRRALVCLIVLVATGALPAAHAGNLSPSEASALIQSTAADTDAMLLSLFYGFQTGQTLDYSSNLATTSWSSTLSGHYMGTSLNLAYSGDLSNYPSKGAVAWTSSGAYGSQGWSGIGSATIADTSATTFQVALGYSMTVGTNSASISYQIPGTVLPSGEVMYGGPGDEEAGTGTLILNGIISKHMIQFSWDETGDEIKSDIIINGTEFEWLNQLLVAARKMFGPVSSGVPEPSSFLLMGLGLLGLVLMRRSAGTAGIGRIPAKTRSDADSPSSG